MFGGLQERVDPDYLLPSGKNGVSDLRDGWYDCSLEPYEDCL